MKVFNLLRNLWQRAKSYSNSNLQTAKDYTNSLCDDLIIYRDFNSSSRTLSANSGGTFSISITIPTGYKYLCNVHAAVAGDLIIVFPDRAGVNLNTNTINVYVFNQRSYSVTATATIRVLYIKDVGGGNT